MWSLLLAAYVSAAAAGAGVWIFRSRPAGMERLLLSFSMGLGLIARAMMLAGWLGLFGRPVFFAAALGMLAALGLFKSGGTGPVLADLRSAFAELRGNAVLLIPSGILLFLILWTASVPPHHYDSLVFPLPLPQAYLY